MSFCIPFFTTHLNHNFPTHSSNLPKRRTDLVKELLLLDKYIDIVIPRGGNLIERISKDSKIQVKHLMGYATFISMSLQIKKELLT